MTLRQRRAGEVASQKSSNGITETVHKPRIVIVGGGPAGAVTAKSLADKDLYDIHLFDAYPHPAETVKNSPKAYVIALSSRGQKGIRESTGIVPSAIPGTVVSTAMTRHPSNKVFSHEKTPSLIAPRKALAAHLLDEAESAGAKVSFQQRLKVVDFKNRIAYFECHGTVEKVPYDFLIGADGCNSTVRQLLDAKADDFTVKRVAEDSMEYQVVSIQRPFAGSNVSVTIETSVHAWNNKEYNSICLAFPLEDKSYLFAIVFPEGKLGKWKRDFSVGHPEGYETALECLLPDLTAGVRDDMIQQLAVGTPSNGGLCVWVSSLGSKKRGVALVGDSAHGMWPSLGQGANCALESSNIFCQVMDDLSSTIGQSSWSADVVREFDARRYNDAVAAVDLTYGGIGARESRGRQNAPLSWKLQIAGIMLLNKLTCGLVPKPALLRVMKGECIPYSTACKFHFYYEKLVCVSLIALCGSLAIASKYYK